MLRYLLISMPLLIGLGCVAQKPPNPAKQQSYREALTRKANAKATVTTRQLTDTEKKEIQAESRKARLGIIVTSGDISQPYTILEKSNTTPWAPSILAVLSTIRSFVLPLLWRRLDERQTSARNS